MLQLENFREPSFSRAWGKRPIPESTICLAAKDARLFADWEESEWWPRLRTAFPRRDDGTPDSELIDVIHAPHMVSDAVIDAYPAELHIDLLERVRGTGFGRRLVERQLAQLQSAGAPGCHLLVAPTNANGIAFYEHLGWHVLERHADEWVMGLNLG